MTKKQLNKILENHKLWINNEGGKRADLQGANLQGADLRSANLQGAYLQYANLQSANLRNADLGCASGIPEGKLQAEF